MTTCNHALEQIGWVLVCFYLFWFILYMNKQLKQSKKNEAKAVSIWKHTDQHLKAANKRLKASEREEA